jgi:hypothetical protein
VKWTCRVGSFDSVLIFSSSLSRTLAPTLRIPKHNVCTVLMLFSLHPSKQQQQHVRRRRRMQTPSQNAPPSLCRLARYRKKKVLRVCVNPKRNVRVIVIKKKEFIVCDPREKKVYARASRPHGQTLSSAFVAVCGLRSVGRSWIRRRARGVKR